MAELTAKEYQWLNQEVSYYANRDGEITITLRSGLKIRGRSFKEVAEQGMSVKMYEGCPPPPK